MNIIKTGFFCGEQLINAPISDWLVGFCVNRSHVGGQVAFCPNSDETFYRSLSGTKWRNWSSFPMTKSVSISFETGYSIAFDRFSAFCKNKRVTLNMHIASTSNMMGEESYQIGTINNNYVPTLNMAGFCYFDNGGTIVCTGMVGINTSGVITVRPMHNTENIWKRFSFSITYDI